MTISNSNVTNCSMLCQGLTDCQGYVFNDINKECKLRI
jgi:hypothetical protein